MIAGFKLFSFVRSVRIVLEVLVVQGFVKWRYKSWIETLCLASFLSSRAGCWLLAGTSRFKSKLDRMFMSARHVDEGFLMGEGEEGSKRS